MNSSRRVGAMPMSAAATAAGTSSIGIRPWNVDPVGDPERGGQFAQRRLRIAATVDVEADVQVRPPGGDRRDCPDRDVQLVRRRQAARVDEPERRRPRGTRGAGARLGSNRLSDGLLMTTETLSARDAEPDEPVAHRLVDRERRRRERRSTGAPGAAAAGGRSGSTPSGSGSGRTRASPRAGPGSTGTPTSRSGSAANTR